MGKVLLVVDDVLSEDEIAITKEFFKNLTDGNSKWVEKDQTVEFPLQKILDIAATVFDLTDMVGCECWSHVNTRTARHMDIDDDHWKRTGEVNHPICSIVYYPHIVNLQGGELVTKTHRIKPIHNRLITFSPGVTHGVDEFIGDRMVCAINPWAYKKQI